MDTKEDYLEPTFIEWQGESIPCYDKHQAYKVAKAWIDLNRNWIKNKYGSGYLYLNVRTFEFVIGDTHTKCAEAYTRFFCTEFSGPRIILGVQL